MGAIGHFTVFDYWNTAKHLWSRSIMHNKVEIISKGASFHF
jgi:hypothetical protein